MPLAERLQRLVEGIDTPIAAFTRDGMFVGASDAAHPLFGFRNLAKPASTPRATTRCGWAGPRRRSASATWCCNA